MNREKIYEIWSSKRLQNGELIAGTKTINNCKRLSDENFDIFYKYIESIIGDSSFRQRRSKVLDFLLYLDENKINFQSVTQKSMDIYFEKCRQKKEADNTIISRVNYLKSMFDFYKGTVENEIDFDKYRISKTEIKKKNPMKSLTIKQLEACRELYRDDMEKQYVIEMLYETEFTDGDLVELTYDKFDIVDRSFNFNGKKVMISQQLANIIEKVKNTKIFTNKYYVMTLLEHIKNDLENIDIANINPQDLKKTRKNMMFMCPQCNKRYEAVVENWCAKQYRKEGSFWIVCRSCGEEK